MSPEVNTGVVGKMIDSMRAITGDDQTGVLPETSRQQLLQAAKDLQYNLETSVETCNRYRYSALDLTITHIFHQIKLFEILTKHDASPVSTDDLAKETHTDPLLLNRLLRCAASSGLVTQTGDDEWSASRLSYSMAIPSSDANVAHAYTTILPFTSDFARFLAQTNYQNPVDGNKTVHQITFDTDLHRFAWMKEHPEHWVTLNNFMASHRLLKTGMEAFPFEDKIPYFSAKTQQDPTTTLVVDIGGGRGQMCRAFRNRFPDLPGRVIVQDLSHTVSSSADDIEAMPHDFFTPQPVKGAKVYYLRNVLHDWPDAKAELILKNTIDAMDKESVILVDEKILPNVGASNVAAGVDLQMMMSYAAQERSEKQWKALMDRVGLKVEELWYYVQDANDGVMLVLPK
ncbi:MAG: hypothetical protein Q9216_003569 [Gyalolechia sp. 2 TL-2023]